MVTTDDDGVLRATAGVVTTADLAEGDRRDECAEERGAREARAKLVSDFGASEPYSTYPPCPIRYNVLLLLGKVNSKCTWLIARL